MRNVINWIFDTKENLTVAIVAVVTVVAIAFLVIVIAEIPARPKGESRPTPTAKPSHTELIPPTTDPIPTVTVSAGPSTLIALEAVDAFLSHDLTRFGRVALPAAVEAVSDTPAPPVAARKVTGKAIVRQGGTTQQTDEVPTSGGLLQLVMVVSGGGWKVSMMRYASGV